jgi:hypothetical protein
MEFKIDNRIFAKLSKLGDPTNTSREGIGRLGILGGNKEIIDTVIWPRITGGCNDCPSISYKNLSEAFIGLVKMDRTIYGLLRYVTEVCADSKDNDPLWISYMLSENMIRLTNASKHELLLIIATIEEEVYYLGCKNPLLYKKIVAGPFFRFPEGKIINQSGNILTVKFTKKNEKALVVSNTPKTKIVARSYSLTNEEIINLHNRPQIVIPLVR